MKKKYVVTFSILIILFVIIYICIPKTKKEVEDNSKNNTTNVNGFLTLMIEQEDGSYQKSTSGTWPGEGYEFNNELSACENGGKLYWDSENNIVKLVTSSSDKCYVYFDIYVEKERNSDEMLAYLNLHINSDIPDFTKTSCSNGSNVGIYALDDNNCGEETVGIYSAEDDVGTSYYFRGDVNNNYVKFANFYWRIIRINGDGSLRLIYDGTYIHANGDLSEDRGIGRSNYNNRETENSYVGYMYGNISSTTYEETHRNLYNSTIKSYIDNWYKNNIDNTKYDDYVTDAIYCNDRGLLLDGGLGYGSEKTFYDGYMRLRHSNTEKNPSLKCNQINDRFSVNNSIKNISTNGDLTYPVGLITADEIAFAGGRASNESGYTLRVNYGFYLYTGYITFSMTPDYVSGLPMIFSIGGPNSDGMGWGGNINTVNCAYTDSLVRPVISLKSSIIVTGSGTISDPFIVKTD